MGGWLVQELKARGADLVLMIRDASPQCLLAREDTLKSVNRVYGSLADLSEILRVLSEYSVKTVFHLAAQPLVGVAKRNPVGTLEANVRGTWNVLEAARLAGVEEVIVASSDKAYGASENLPYRETHALQGRFPYDVSKSCADLISSMYAATFGIRVGITRCANLFGGGDLNFSRMLPDLICSTLRAERFVIRSDGKFVRDFLYVRDAVAAYLMLAERLSQSPELSGEAFNFGLDTGVQMLDLVYMVLKIMGRTDLEPIIQNAASAEIREQYLSSEKARRILGWKPQYSLEEGLRETINWYRKYAPTGIMRPSDSIASWPAKA